MLVARRKREHINEHHRTPHLSSSEDELHSEDEDVPDPANSPRLPSFSFFSFLCFFSFFFSCWSHSRRGCRREGWCVYEASC